MEAKQKIRKNIQEKTQSFMDSGKSMILCQKLISQNYWETAEHILIYAPLPGEVDTNFLLTQNKNFYFPKAIEDQLHIYKVSNTQELKQGTFGVLEPQAFHKKVNPEILDLIIVPGLAFDRSGTRLGKGKGYYDRFLSGLFTKKKIQTVSLAFDFQIVEKIPIEKHDIRIDHIISE